MTALKVDFLIDQMFRLLRGKPCLSETLADPCFLIVSMPLLSIENHSFVRAKLKKPCRVDGGRKEMTERVSR